MPRYRKRFYGVTLVLSLLALTLQTTTHAQTPFQGYTTATQIANVSTTNSALVTLTAYTPDGTEIWSMADPTPILANQSRTYFPITNNATLKGAFVGSLVATASSGVIVSIANLVSTDGIGGASFIGQNTGSNTVSLPLLMKNNSGFYTWFSVQNANLLNTANVMVKYSDNTSINTTIAPGAVQNFFQAAESHSQAVFAATITSNVAVVAVVVEESAAMMLAYTGFKGNGTITPAFPMVNTNNSGFITGIQLQNNGGQPTTVTITYQPSSAGTACTETQTLPAAGVKSFALAAFSTNQSSTSTTCAAGQTFIGSARVTSNSANQPLTGVVNQVKSSANQGGAYGGFDPSAATNKVVFPLIMDRNSGYFTGFSIQNVGTATSSVTCTFANSSRTLTVNLAPSQTLTDLQANKLADKYVGSALCQAANINTRLVGIVNELGPSTTLDQLLVYEGINVQ